MDSDKNLNLDFGTLIRLLMMQSKLIFFLAFIALGLLASWYKFTVKTYQVSSLLYIDAPSTDFTTQQIPLDIAGTSSNSSILDLIRLYNSRTNTLRLINDLKLNIAVTDGIDKNDINLKIDDPEIISSTLYLDLNKEYFSVTDNFGQEILKNVAYGITHFTQNISINILENRYGIDKNIEISYQHPESLITYYQSIISLQSLNDTRMFFTFNNGLVKSSIITSDVEEGKKILDYANKIFIENDIEAKSLKANQALKFIDGVLASTKTVLDENKLKLNNFQRENTSINVDIEVETIINSLSNIERQIKANEVELSRIDGLYTVENPIYRNLLNQTNTLIEQRNEIENEIQNLPSSQQDYIDLFRDLEFSQQLFADLQNRKLGLSIAEASTLGNIRVVDEAYVEARVSPLITSLLFFSVLSMLGIFGIVIFRGLFFMPITNPAELADHKIESNIIGVIPFIDEIKELEENQTVRNSLESLVLNLQHMKNNLSHV